jgi:hypothetical protein
MLELKLEPYIKDMTKLRKVLIDTGVGTGLSEGWLLVVSKMSIQRGLSLYRLGSLFASMTKYNSTDTSMLFGSRVLYFERQNW